MAMYRNHLFLKKIQQYIVIHHGILVYDTPRWIHKWQQLENIIFFGGSYTIPYPTFLFSFRITLLKRGQVQSGWTACLVGSVRRSLSLPSGRSAESTLEIRHRFCWIQLQLPRGLRSDSHSMPLRNQIPTAIEDHRSGVPNPYSQLPLNPAATAFREHIGAASRGSIRGCPCSFFLSQSSLVFDTKCINTQSFVNRGHHSVAQKLRSKASCRLRRTKGWNLQRATESGSVVWTCATYVYIF